MAVNPPVGDTGSFAGDNQSTAAQNKAQPAAPAAKRAITRRASLAWLGSSLVVGPIFHATKTLAKQENGFALKLKELALWTQNHGGQLSACAVDLETGAPVAAHAAELVLNPASNMKLVTAAVALDRLGPQMRFQTGLYGQVDGVSIPTLVLKGHGDPSLSESGLWRLANVIGSMGVKKVNGVLVDQSAFDDRFVPPAFEQQPNEWAAFRAPISAVAVEGNVLTCNVLASAKAGDMARVWVEPAGAVVTAGSVRTEAPGKGQRVEWRLAPNELGTSSEVGGYVAQGMGRLRFSKHQADPRLAPGQVLAHQLRGLGVTVGAVGLGSAGRLPRITYHSSAPLSALLLELGKNSDNFYAEMVFKSLATAEALPPATTAAAADIVNQWLNELGPRPADERIVNGSGLFDASRLCSRTLASVLRHAYQSPRLGVEFMAHLAIGGVDGTLTSRFRPLRERRCIRAKTGTLDSAIALSGYALRGLKTGSAFSIIVNGLPGRHSQVRAKIDAAVSALV